MTPPAENPPRPSVEIRLFGGFDARLDGAPLPSLRSRREQWLLALLVLRHDRDTAREWLAAILWPDAEAQQALFYLRKSLSNLRQALGSEATRLLAPTPRTVRLDLTDAFADVLAFDNTLKQAAASSDPTTALQEGVALYRGPLLPDCSEEWASVERNQRAEAYLTALESLATRLYAQGEPRKSVPWLRLLLDADPYRESACLLLMQALADCGDQAAVTVVYQDLRARLRQDLNAAPAPETEALYRCLRQQERTTVAPSPPPAPNAPSARRHLPVPLTDLIGREGETAEVLGWMRQRRLVTLVGAGGIGKTRLAIATAEAALERFAEGVWFVDLAPLSDPALTPQATARALGVAEQPGRSPIEVLAETLTARTLLLVLDNCEHLSDACAELAHTLLSACPALSILATSRQALNVMGEQVYPVPPLPLPPIEMLLPNSGEVDQEKDPHVLMEYEAIGLFVERAARANNTFRLTRRNAAAVVDICRQLDGIPLAIEMAAARLRSLSVGEIQSRLADRFRLLTSGYRGVLPRQQTLRAAIDWSYDQLTPEERTLLRRLSVFTGGWMADAAESVCGDALDLPDLLASLVEKSLVLRREEEEEVRYGMLETIRQYAQERLEQSGESPVLRRRHRDYFLTLAESGRARMAGPEAAPWLSVLEQEHNNLRQALAFCKQESSEAVAGLQLTVALQRYWQVRGHFRESREHYAALLALPIPPEAASVRADALNGAGVMAAIQGDLVLARSQMEACLAIKRELGDKKGIAQALNNLGNVAAALADPVSAQSLYQESLTLRRELGDRQGIADSLGSLGQIAYDQSDYATARSRHQECLELMKELGDRRGLAGALNNLANVAVNLGDYAAARALYQESLTIKREWGDRLGIANTLNNLGNVAYYQLDYASARALYQECLAIKRELGDRQGIADSLDTLGNIADNEGDYLTARAHYQESLALKRELDDRKGIANALNHLGIVAYRQGDYLAARTLHEESLTIKRELGERRMIAHVLQNLGNAVMALGLPHEARACYEEALQIDRDLGHRAWEASDLACLGSVALSQGDFALARAHHQESLTLRRKLGERQEIAASLEAFADLAHTQACHASAARLWGAASVLRAEIGLPLPPNRLGERESRAAAAREALGAEAFAAAWAEGCAMTGEQSIDYALEDPFPLRGS